MTIEISGLAHLILTIIEFDAAAVLEPRLASNRATGRLLVSASCGSGSNCTTHSCAPA